MPAGPGADLRYADLSPRLRDTGDEGVRFSQFTAFRTTGPGWLGSTSFQGAGGSSAMDDLITHASPRERELIGFPAPGDPYWDEETIPAVAARYPGMDMGPYAR